MRVYIVARAEAWESAKQTGELRGKDFALLTPYEQQSMKWLQAEATKRIQGFSGDVPVFGWAQKPGMHELNEHARVGDHVVVLEAEISPDRILPMHFTAWAMYVMNGMFLALSTDEEDSYVSNPLREVLEASWCRIFEPWTLANEFPSREIMYAIDGVKVSEVIRVTHEVVPPVPEIPPAEYYAEPVEDTAIPLDDPRITSELRSILSRPNLYN
jgi:hypothetical protein